MRTVSIQIKTMNFGGGIVVVGGRYYQVIFKDDDPRTNYYAKATDLPLEQLLENYGLDCVGWPNKKRDMNPNYKGSRNQLSRRALKWLNR